jgi:hypothetical protein
MPGVVFEAILIVLAVVAAIPTYFAVVWYEEGSVVLEGDGDFELFEDAGDDAIFFGFGVLDGDGVVVLEEKDGVAFGPDAEHGGVDYVGE